MSLDGWLELVVEERRHPNGAGECRDDDRTAHEGDASLWGAATASATPSGAKVTRVSLEFLHETLHDPHEVDVQDHGRNAATNARRPVPSRARGKERGDFQ